MICCSQDVSGNKDGAYNEALVSKFFRVTSIVNMKVFVSTL